MATTNAKRPLESPENLPQDKKQLRSSIYTDHQIQESSKINLSPNHIYPSQSNTTTNNMDERDEKMLEKFDLMLQKQFSLFSKAHIEPMMQELAKCKDENVKLRDEVKSCVDRISFLERTIRESNLVFSNVPASENNLNAIEDICKNLLKVTETDIEKIIPVKENKQQNTVTLLTTFKSRRTVDVLLRKASLLKGTRIGISRDLPKEERMARNTLLKLRREIMNTGTEQKIKVFGKHIVIDKEKFTFENNFLGNSKVDGKVFILENFGINFYSIISNNQ